MSVSTVLENYQKVAAKLNQSDDIGLSLPALDTAPYRVNVVSELVADPQLLATAISDFGGTTGWLGYQSGNEYFETFSEIVMSDRYGMLLNAEMANESNASLHIRYNGDGGWIVTTFNYTGEDSGEGDWYLADSLGYVSSFNDGLKLQYKRFWKQGDGCKTTGVNPEFACFTGFGG